MTDDKVQISYSFPFCSVLFVLFLALKLTGHINWSWWWVTAPLWGPWAVFFGFVLVLLIFAAACGLATEILVYFEKRAK